MQLIYVQLLPTARLTIAQWTKLSKENDLIIIEFLRENSNLVRITHNVAKWYSLR